MTGEIAATQFGERILRRARGPGQPSFDESKGVARPAAHQPRSGRVAEQMRHRLTPGRQREAALSQSLHDRGALQWPVRQHFLQQGQRLVATLVRDPEFTTAPRGARLQSRTQQLPQPARIAGRDEMQGATHRPGAHDARWSVDRRDDVPLEAAFDAGAYGESHRRNLLCLQAEKPVDGARNIARPPQDERRRRPPPDELGGIEASHAG